MYLTPIHAPLFCSVLEFGPDPTPPTPLFQGAPGRLFPRAPALASPSRLGCCYLFIARAFMIGRRAFCAGAGGLVSARGAPADAFSIGRDLRACCAALLRVDRPVQPRHVALPLLVVWHGGVHAGVLVGVAGPHERTFDATCLAARVGSGAFIAGGVAACAARARAHALHDGLQLGGCVLRWYPLKKLGVIARRPGSHASSRARGAPGADDPASRGVPRRDGEESKEEVARPHERCGAAQGN